MFCWTDEVLHVDVIQDSIFCTPRSTVWGERRSDSLVTICRKVTQMKAVFYNYPDSRQMLGQFQGFVYSVSIKARYLQHLETDPRSVFFARNANTRTIREIERGRGFYTESSLFWPKYCTNELGVAYRNLPKARKKEYSSIIRALMLLVSSLNW